MPAPAGGAATGGAAAGTRTLSMLSGTENSITVDDGIDRPAVVNPRRSLRSTSMYTSATSSTFLRRSYLARMLAGAEGEGEEGGEGV